MNTTDVYISCMADKPLDDLGVAISEMRDTVDKLDRGSNDYTVLTAGLNRLVEVRDSLKFGIKMQLIEQRSAYNSRVKEAAKILGISSDPA
jgi:hypothetical protein